MNDVEVEIARFQRGECDPANFPHHEHVRMGFEMLRRYSFPETVSCFSHALRQMAARAGRPEAYHETITIAFLSLIAERMRDPSDFETFSSRNRDLFDKRVLDRWYSAERLASDAARRTFLLPSASR